MASLLTYTWKKTVGPFYPRLQSSRSIDDDKSLGRPGVSASASEETALSMPSSSESYVDEAVEKASEGTNTRPLVSPRTPDALRRRKTAGEIRQELGLPPRQRELGPLPWSQQQQQLHQQPSQQGFGHMDALAAAYQYPFPHAPHVNPEMNQGFARAVSSSPSMTHRALPPMLQSLPSPQVSTSSFYSKAGTFSRGYTMDTPVVHSPNLELGQAKTAVGALVAMNASNHQQPTTETFSNQQVMALHPESSILPSRAWLREERSIEEAHDFSMEFPSDGPMYYESLNDSRGGQFASPARQPSGFRGNFSDEESSIHASPSSNNYRENGISDHFASQIPETSFTRAFFQSETSRLSTGQDHYDFNSIMDKKVNIGEDTQHMEKVPSREDRELANLPPLFGEPLPPLPTFAAVKTKEHQFRSTNERRIREDLLISILERLQDDTDLVLEVMNALQESDGKLRESMLGEGFITGISEGRREALTKSIDGHLVTLKAKFAQDDLIHCLSFCRSIVQASIPENEKRSKLKHSITGIPEHGHRWQRIPGLRAALGFDEEPQSPETIRGGDTSLFSLPSESANDSTPHTSNVSMTSTITSALTPDRNMNLDYKKANFSQGRMNLKKTTEDVCTIFCKMGNVCLSLSDAKKSKTALFDLKQLYAQLLELSEADLKTLINSFELEMVSLCLSRVVSEDQDDQLFRKKEQLNIQQVFPEENSSAPQAMGFNMDAIEFHVVEDQEGQREPNNNLFSPVTADMQSLERAETSSPVDDLRRVVGSFDSCDTIQEEREGAPPIQALPPSRRDRKTRGLRGIFKRRRENRRRKQAAE